jgi:methylamine dehydrogenase heavy chain
MRLTTTLLAACSALGLAFAPELAAAQTTTPVLVEEPLGNVEIPDQKPGEHRIWWTDFAGGLYGRAWLINADTGERLGSVDTGWEGIKLDMPRSGDVFYNNALYLSRAYRGKRTDVVEIFDRKTLQLKGEIVVPPKAIRGWPNLNHSALSDDDRFLLLQFFTPASSIGVVDVKARKFVGEVETAGCAHTMAAGPRRFFTLCGDGSLLSVSLDERGRERSRERTPGVFDPVGDPLHGTGVRIGTIWYLVTHKGVVQPIDVSGDRLRPLPKWQAGEISGQEGWVPGEILQNLAVHERDNTLYILMRHGSLAPKGGGTDYHRQPGTEVWAFDAATGKRLRRMPLMQPTQGIAVSQDDSPRLYASTLFGPKLQVLEARTGREVRVINAGLAMPAMVQPVEPR